MYSPFQSTTGTPFSSLTGKVRPSDNRTGIGAMWPAGSSLATPQQGEAMKANTRSGVTPARKRSLVVIRILAAVPKFGS